VVAGSRHHNYRSERKNSEFRKPPSPASTGGLTSMHGQAFLLPPVRCRQLVVTTEGPFQKIRPCPEGGRQALRRYRGPILAAALAPAYEPTWTDSRRSDLVTGFSEMMGWATGGEEQLTSCNP